MAKKKHISGDKKKQAKQGARLLDDRPKAPANTDKIQLIRFDKYQALFLTLLVIVGVIIYSNTLQVPFILDDKDAIKNNPYIRMEEITAESIIDAAVGYGKNRPVAMLSFAFNYYFGQYNVLGYHLVNIIIHIANGILLFFFLKITLALSNQQTDAARKLNQTTVISLSFFTALLWLVNPIQTQTATYIVQRMNSMGAMFYIIALLLYAKGRLAQQQTSRALGSPSQKDGKKRLSKSYYFWFAGCFVAGVLALGSKESTVLLPVFIFLYEWYFLQDLSKDWFKRSLKWVLGITVLTGIVALIYLDFNLFEKISRLHDFSKNEFTIAQRALTQLRVVIYYISLLFYPHPSRLNLDYDFPLSYSLFNPFTTFLSLIIIVALIALGLYLAKRQRLISFCILWFFGNLVIESSFIPLALIFEHRLYLPSMLVFLMTAILLYRYIKPAWLTVFIACIMVSLSSYWTFERNKVWRDEMSLWADCVKKSPNKVRPYYNLGEAQAKRQKNDEAIQNYLKALQIKPDGPTHNNLGLLLAEQGRINEAIEHYHKALQIKPDFARAHNNLAISLVAQDKTDEAEEHYRKALRYKPDNADVYNNLGILYTKQNKIDAAIEHYIKSLQLKPDYAEAHNNLGGILLGRGEIDEALVHFNAVLKINPDMSEAHNNIGIIMIQKGNIYEAISHFQEAVRINPEFELAQENLQRALAIRQSPLDMELEKIRAALKNNPGDPQLNYELGNLYLGKGELNEAIRQFQKALSLQPNFLEALNNLAMAHTFGRQYDQALKAFQKLIALQPDNAANYYNVAVLYALQINVTESLAWLNKAVAKGYDNWDLIKTDKDLENIRNAEGYRELVKGR